MSDDLEHNKEREANKRPRVSRFMVFRSVASAVFTLAVLIGVGGGILALIHPDTPLPDEWNPTTPLSIAAPVTPLTSMKLRRALNNPQMCVDVLSQATNARQLDPFEVGEDCHVRNRVSLSSMGNTRIDTVETSCATALRMAMWDRHGVQPAARDILGTDVTTFRQIGSYNCRPIRTTSGNGTRWSTHSTADAIDITGFDLSDGRTVRLIRDWDGVDAEAQFLRAVRDSACNWFATTLGPDFNSLHADHFHLQARGWGTCR